MLVAPTMCKGHPLLWHLLAHVIPARIPLPSSQYFLHFLQW